MLGFSLEASRMDRIWSEWEREEVERVLEGAMYALYVYFGMYVGFGRE